MPAHPPSKSVRCHLRRYATWSTRFSAAIAPFHAGGTFTFSHVRNSSRNFCSFAVKFRSMASTFRRLKQDFGDVHHAHVARGLTRIDAVLHHGHAEWATDREHVRAALQRFTRLSGGSSTKLIPPPPPQQKL